MVAHSDSIPRAPSPFRRASRVSIPGRGRVTSAMLALGVILLLVVAGVLVVLTYLRAVEDAPNEAAEQGTLVQPMVDLSE